MAKLLYYNDIMPSFDPRQMFADQFEPQPDGSFLYRKNSRGAPIPVTAAERDQYVAAFARSNPRLRHIFVAVVVIIIFAVAGVAVWRGQDVPQVDIWAILVISLAVYLVL